MACKSYSARGVVTIGIWFEDSYYVVLGEGGEEQPLLDSRYGQLLSVWFVAVPSTARRKPLPICLMEG